MVLPSRVEEFAIEAREHLGAVEESLLAVENPSQTADTTALFDRCFRSIHSIKGDAGFLGLSRIHELAHAMESLLSVTQQPLAPRVIEVLLAARDRLAVMVDNPQHEADVDITDILHRLSGTDSYQGASTFEVDLAAWNIKHPGGIASFVRNELAARNIRHGQTLIESCDLRNALPSGPVRWQGTADSALQSAGTHARSITVDLADLSEHHQGLVSWFCELQNLGEIGRSTVRISENDLRTALPSGPVLWAGEITTDLNETELISRLGLPHRSMQGASVLDPNDVQTVRVFPLTGLPAELPAAAKSNVTTSVSSADAEKSTTLRIQVELLDRLMTLVGELTLVRNQSLLAFAEEDGPQRAIIQRLNSVTSELQDATLRARMQPVGNLFNRFPRMVRDLARQLGKQIEIELQGREVELDKTILEQLSDPLMHLVRNSVDHGIELPAERAAKGKSPVGRIVLSATHEDGQVHVRIRDDGKGIDPDVLKARALALRLKSDADLERMTRRELFGLILLPGFSTARKVTEVSGRGVGMDVVKTNIEQLKGTLNIDSAPGLGSSIELRLPLTLAIIPCLVVTVGDERFAVPQRELEGVVCLHPQAQGRIEQAFDTEVYRLREKLLPVVRLSEVLARREPFGAEAKAEILTTHSADLEQRIEYILVLKIAGRRFGLVVDEVCGTQEIVVKPLHPSIKRGGIFTGATIMGDGRVALIVDSEGIIEHARLSFESALEGPTISAGVRDAALAHRVLLFEYGPQEQFALPLIQIRRIEMVDQNRIERVGDNEYVTVDGTSTRILRLDKVIHTSPLVADTPLMSLILPKFVQSPVGILVSRIVDTESLALELQQQPEQNPEILGSAIVRDRLTLFLDMHRLSEKLFGVPAKATAALTRGAPNRTKRLLLIDDTAFFREVVKRYLVAEGHEISTAIHGEDALAQLSRGPGFDMIVSDIEMPVMDGWEFAREARRRGIKTPMLALTSLSGIQYENKAKECGFDSYEVKLDHDRLVRKVAGMLSATEALS